MSLLRVPDAVVALTARLEQAGHETWCVGGAVRDALLGHPQLDWDLATAAHPEEVQRLFRRTVPVGIRFGTVGVFDRDGRMHEVTTFRQDIETDGRHAVVRFSMSIDEDLSRRDLTINAIAYSPSRDVLHDPFGGREDLERRRVRAVGDPAARMREDRLRALRAVRFAARFGFEIEAQTWGAIVESAPFLQRLSPERVREELEKTMEQVARPSLAIAQWKASGALGVLIPVLAEIDETTVRIPDHLATPGPIRRRQRTVARLTGLFSDVPAAQLSQALKDLRFSNSETTWMAGLVRIWQRLGDTVGESLLDARAPVPAPRVRTWVAVIGRTRVHAFFRLASAVWCARREAGITAPEPMAVRRAYRTFATAAWRDPIELADLAVGGEDLIKAGIVAGPRIGKILATLLRLVLDDPTMNDRERLIRAALSISDA